MKYTAVRALMLTMGILGMQVAGASENYPNRPVTIVVPFPAGGSVDNLTRVIAQRLTEKWGQPVVIENKTGASSLIGADFVSRAKPDGYTLMHALSTMHQATYIIPTKLKPAEDFEAISMTAATPLWLVAHPSVEANNLTELVEAAKKDPQKYSAYGSYASASTGHLYGHVFNDMAGLKMEHIAYRGEAPSVTDLLGGQIPLVFMSGNGAKAHVQEGKMKLLAVTGQDRSLVYPEVKTFKEQGFDAKIPAGWYGFFAPKGTSKEILNKVSQDVNDILKDPEIKKNFAALDINLHGTTPEAFAALQQPHYEEWGAVIKATGVADAAKQQPAKQ